LMRTELLDVYFRHEYRGSQARVTLMYKNLKTDGTPLTHLDATLNNHSPMFRTQVPKHGTRINGGATMTEIVVLELLTPFAEPPELVMSFLDGESLEKSTAYKYIVPLPITLTHFLSPVILAQEHFMTRWEALAANEFAVEGPSKLSMDPASFASVQGRLRTIKFGLGEDALQDHATTDDKGGSARLACCAALHTKTREKSSGEMVLVGIMATVLIEDGTVHVTVRAPVRKAAELLAKTLLAQLES